MYIQRRTCTRFAHVGLGSYLELWSFPSQRGAIVSKITNLRRLLSNHAVLWAGDETW